MSTIESPTTDVTTGLTAAEVAERVAAGQTNDVPSRASRTVGEIVRANVFTRFNAIVGVLFAIILVIGPIQDGLFGFVILINTGIGIFQELRAKRTLERLAIVGEARPRVRRDGTTAELSPGEVVLGDVIELGPGDKIVVDGVVLAADGLEVDESLLTGESDPVHKLPGDQVLSGSFVAAGGGAHQATKVGREAYAARLAEEASKFTLVNSELRSGINRILKIITYLLVPAAALIIWSQFRTVGNDLPEALRGMVAALVPMVPEGLVLLTSIAFAVGVIRLGKRNCLVQELPAIEGLARVDTVCADKTGTLTENGMRLSRVDALGGHAEADARDVLGALGVADKRPNASLAAIAEACPPPQWTVVTTQPFSSARKWSGASFAEHGNWVLGAPDVLLPEDSAERAEAERVGADGLRVLLLGRGSRVVDDPAGPGDVEAVALVVLEQKVRPEAADTLAYFAEQNVDVKVISGDNAVSVAAVASSLGLTGAHAPVDARELPEAKESLADEVDAGTVFGRVTPAQKRSMVGALQSRGHTVAMTGDGVNDVLALKDADIGVAMGSGSPATRAVAQIVLLDDSFATLPHVVAEGRRVIGNIERVANLFLTKTVYSVLLAIAIGAIGVPFPFLPRHLTLIGSLTIGIPAFFLALAPNTERARTGFVKRVLRLAAPSGIIAGAGTVVTYLIVRTDPTATSIQQSTAAVLTLYLIATGVLVVVARPFVWWKAVLVVASLAAFAHALLSPLPFGREFWQLDAGNTATMLVGLVVAIVGIVLVEVANLVITRRLARATPAPASD
ncbi:ATPase, P-type (transporting), HAD superfamily, subfamily IC [Pseudonocardia dioxanivorans CB1190]|uniref:ATPase, P-type (Transporting), HAD superfamily, subfamily IC n=1 Tax=Pseudonocardia dioxanivorans (strain ATCC 55486 / DSM 44775 / JCM 13855 / CB1190) TaxID=675635 RepID=F4CS62_PSEUX|nr:HAD-IC family P-type ATPase [Pseudonocardia dioxanivorans]AEA22622.1 ATPase, P-type (transporting), HAD superfamily, subfamily IC [Pseudonocardia dioxanivorans CB1190]